MAFLTGREDDTPERLDELTRQAKIDLLSGEISQEEYESQMTQLEARRAMLSVAPVLDANVEDRLKDLEYLHEKQWIGEEEYLQKKKEILQEL